MRLIFCFFLLLSTTVIAQTQYQEHFPRDIYEYIAQVESFDEELLENTINKQSTAGDICITLSSEKGEDSEPLVVIDFWLENAVDNFHGIQVGYRNGRMFGYAVFDEQGRDYVAFAPFSCSDEKQMEHLILKLLDGSLPE